VKRRELLGLAGAGLLTWTTGARAQTGQTKGTTPKGAVKGRVPKPESSADTELPAVPRIALVGATLLGASERPLERAVVVLQGERIASIGTDASAAAGATTIDVSGKMLTAGFVDPLTRVGVTEIDLEDRSRDDAHSAGRTIAASFSAADGYDPASPLVGITRGEGITSVGVVPASGLVMGQSAWADLDGDLPERALGARSLALHVLLDDYALGSGPVNHATALHLLRDLFDDAEAYRSKRGDYEKRQVRELGASRGDLEVVSRVLDGKLPLVFHVDRASDISNVLDLAKSRKLRAIVASAAEGWKVAGALAAASVPAIVYPLDEGPRDLLARGAREDNAALLHKAGVVVAMSTGESHNARKLRQVAGNAVRAGLPHAAAISALTRAPAQIFGLGDYGAPAAKRLANLAVWSGDPLELSSRCERLFIRGREVGLRSRQTALFEKYR
jgi:imidazolonepropionase-like amidohydrolase